MGLAIRRKNKTRINVFILRFGYLVGDWLEWVRGFFIGLQRRVSTLIPQECSNFVMVATEMKHEVIAVTAEDQTQLQSTAAFRKWRDSA